MQRFNNNDFFDDKFLKVLEVFGYLNGSGVNQQKKIMSDSDYRRLILLTVQMVQMESVPEMENPFDRLQVTNELLRYSYYVLHKELFGVQPRRTFFTRFLETTFTQMQGIDSLAAKFAQKPRNVPDYASEIIKEHWNRK